MNPADGTLTFRPPVMAQRHIACAGHYWSSLAAFEILEAGGNAVDAGVAAGLATNVLESEFTGFGGVAPTMIYRADRDEIVTLGGVGVWPKAATCEYFHARHKGRVPDGILRTVVPAAPDIWLTALERWGTMSFGDVAKSAIRFARAGFPMYAMFLEVLTDKGKSFQKWPTTGAVYMPNGRLPQIGETFVQDDLGQMLQFLADEEKSHAGKGRAAGIDAARRAFYQGDIAAKIVRQQVEMGGLMTADDLAGYRADVEMPVRIRFGDLDVYGCGAWSQGPMVLEALRLVEKRGLAAMGHNSAQHIHHVAEALKLAAADREVYFGDPKFVDVPLDQLLSDANIAERQKSLRTDRAWPEMPPPSVLAGRAPIIWKADPSSNSEASALDREAIPETSYLCVVDAKGNVFSSTPSDGTISGPVVPGTGMTTSMWGSRAYTDPAHPAAVGPGRRPRMSANPMIAMRKGEMVMPLGSPGSEVLGQAQVQAFLNKVVFGMDPQAAVEAPRVASYSWPGSALPHSYSPGRLNMEARIDRAVGDELQRMGHKVAWWPRLKWTAGSVCMIHADLRTGLKQGGADPRRTAYAIGW